jgi:hypothetical protein
MKRLGIASLLSALLVSGAVLTGSPMGVSASTLNQNYTQPGSSGTANAAAGAAAKAAAAAAAAAQAAKNCQAVGSAHCKALAAAAAAAAAAAKRLEQKAQALAQAAGLPIPTFPSTGGGGTAGIVPVVAGVTSVGPRALSGAKSVTSLPATGGGAVPSSPDSAGGLAILGLVLAMAGLAIRRLFR